METERWELLERLYHAALELEPDRRGAYLHEACSADASLRQDVESLLARVPMRPEQALSAVYDTAPHLMDEPLARRIVAFVAAAAQGESGEIEPALLSLFCRGLNERRKKQRAERFDAQLLEGAQQSIIADYYRSCVEGLPDSVSRFIESDLITEKGFRNSYAKDDAVPAFLAVPQDAVACIPYRVFGKALLRRLQFLQTGDIRTRLFEPA